MKKIILTVIVAMLVSVGANAQFKFGLKGGWNFQNFDISGNLVEQLKKDNFVSWDLGIVAQIPLAGAFHLQPEVLYSSQKIDLLNDHETFLPEITNQLTGTQRIAYFQVPVNVLCKINLIALSVFASGGPYFGYAVDKNSLSANSLRKTNWGVSLGVGAEFMRFQVSARYKWALKNISDIDNITWKSNKFSLSIAYFIL